MQSLLLTLAFLLEIVAFISFAAFGYVFHIAHWLQLLLFVALLLILLTFWSLFMAPKAHKKFSPLPYYIAKSIIYTMSAITIYVTKGAALGTAFVVLALLDEIFLFRHNLAKK